MNRALVFVPCSIVLPPAPAQAVYTRRHRQEPYSGPRSRLSVSEVHDRSACRGILAPERIIAGAVAEFVSGSLAVKGGAEVAGIRVDGTMNKGYVGLDTRVNDARTSEVFAAAFVRRRVSSCGFEADPGEEAKLPVSLSIFPHTPAERANAIKKAVDEILPITQIDCFRHLAGATCMKGDRS